MFPIRFSIPTKRSPPCATISAWCSDLAKPVRWRRKPHYCNAGPHLLQFYAHFVHGVPERGRFELFSKTGTGVHMKDYASALFHCLLDAEKSAHNTAFGTTYRRLCLATVAKPCSGSPVQHTARNISTPKCCVSQQLKCCVPYVPEIDYRLCREAWHGNLRSQKK